MAGSVAQELSKETLRRVRMKVLFFCGEKTRADPILLGMKLQWLGLTSLWTAEARVGLHMVEANDPDLVVICQELPDLSIPTTIRRIRRLSDVPIVVAVEGCSEKDVARAIELGADEFIDIPSSPMIVMSRIAALLRRTALQQLESEGDSLRRGNLVVHPANQEVFLGSDRVELTPTEFRLLHLLAQNDEVTLTQEVIQREIWPEGVGGNDALKKYIQRLRGKLGDDPRNPTWITTVHGVGYRFSFKSATLV